MRTFARVVLLAAVAAQLLACDEKPSPPAGAPFSGPAFVDPAPTKAIAAPPEITSEVDSGAGAFQDLVLHLQTETSANGGTEIRAKGLYKGKAVGFNIAVPRAWGNPQPIGGTGLSFVWGSLRLESVGPESDAFVGALDEVYGVKSGATAMKKRVDLRAVCLEGDPLNLQAGIARIKCFVGTGDEEAQFFLNIDAPKRRVEFHEKDMEYRSGVVRNLARE